MQFEVGSIIWNEDKNNRAGTAPSGKFIVRRIERATFDDDDRLYLRAELIERSFANGKPASKSGYFLWWLMPENCHHDFIHIARKIKEDEARNRK